MFSPPSLHVAIGSTQAAWRGGEEQARLLARGLRQRGHAVTIVARADGQFAARMSAEGFAVAAYPGRGRSPRSLWAIGRQLRRLRPDILYYNDAHASTALGLAAVGLPAVRVAARRVDFPLRSATRYRWFCDRVVCVSHAVADICRAGGLGDDRLRVVHDGVDPARVASGERQRGRTSLGIAADAPLLLTVAALTDHKGHRFLLEALPAVRRQFPRVRLALAGDGELERPLRQQAERLGIADCVDFLGFRGDVPDLIQAADLFVMPSHLEGLCSTLIDVMLAERPIVATTAGGIPELLTADAIDGGPVAWLVPPREPSPLATAIVAALADRALAAAHARRAHARAQRLFTADQMVDATLGVFREAWGASRRLAA